MTYYNNELLEKPTYYFGNYEKIKLANGDITELHYIAGGDGLAAIHVITTPITQPSTPSTFYTYTDHLGSILTLTDQDANLVYEQNFDAWGRERNPDTWDYSANSGTKPEWLTRGYTGHEHLAEFGLINMNGRLYDPILGRMLSPDNYVQSPFSSQSYNRYSYVINNPLKYIDPSGENWWDDVKDGWENVKDAYNDFWEFLNGTPNPQTGQNEGGLAQQVPSWVPDFSVGVNSSGQTFHTVGNSGPIYHNNNSYTIPGINWSEVNYNNYVGGMPTTGLFGEPLFDPTLTVQTTQGFFTTPGLEMEGHSSLTIKEGKSNVEIVKNNFTLEIESTIIKKPTGNYSFGSDGSFTYGNDYMSYGTTSNGIYILDLSIQTGRNTSVGTTLYYNPQVFQDNWNYIKNSIGRALSNPPSFYPYPPIMPIPIFIP
jgi:RHS repeat-associated protein